jgi:hypothetical protein
MHSGGYTSLVSLAWVAFFGALSVLAFPIYVFANKRHSFHGLKGVLLYVMVAVFLIVMAVALDNLLWDVLAIREQLLTVPICVIISYVIPLAFLSKLYRKEQKGRINMALVICGILLAVLVIGWYIAETAI